MSTENPYPAAELHQGHVSSFDQRRGLGEVIDADGERFGFHATAIADGTRSVAQGAPVTFLVVPGRRGRYEAAALTTT